MRISSLFPLLLVMGSSYGLSWDHNYTEHEYAIETYPQYDGLTWSTARAGCLSEGGDLAWFDSREEHDWVVAKLESGNKHWLGLTSRMDGEWRWADGGEVSVDRWAVGEPGFGEMCGLVRTSQWYSENCGTPAGYICKRGEGETAPRTTLPPQTVEGYCPTGWTPTDTNRCYRVDSAHSVISWEDAHEACTLINHHKPNLACANAPGEIQALTEVAKTYRTTRDPFWIGLYRRSETGKVYTWTDNTEVKVDNLHRGSIPTEGCGYLHRDLTPAYSWDLDGPHCRELTQYYICQIEKDPNNIIPTPEPTTPTTTAPTTTTPSSSPPLTQPALTLLLPYLCLHVGRVVMSAY